MYTNKHLIFISILFFKMLKQVECVNLSASAAQKYKRHYYRNIQQARGGQLTPVESGQCHRFTQLNYFKANKEIKH
jgi:hypothetical protein